MESKLGTREEKLHSITFFFPETFIQKETIEIKIHVILNQTTKIKHFSFSVIQLLIYHQVGKQRQLNNQHPTKALHQNEY